MKRRKISRLFRFAVLSTSFLFSFSFLTATPAASPTVPTMEIEILPGVYVNGAKKAYVPLGQLVALKYYAVESYEGKWQQVQATVNLYSGGVLIDSQVSSLKADGYPKLAVFDPPVVKGKKNYGPFLVCAYFKDARGNTSPKAPCSDSSWIAIEVPIFLVSNGCGGQTGYKKIDQWEKTLLDERTLGNKTVDFRPACNAHDAGYSGFTIKNPRTGEVIDYLRYSRNMVDGEFLLDFQKICEKNFPLDGSDVIAAGSCYQWAGRYFSAVSQIGSFFYDANPVLPGIQTKYERPVAGTVGPRAVGFKRNNT